MTTAQLMLLRSAQASLLVLALSIVAGCQKERHVEPVGHDSPFSAYQPVVWAVVPLRNESGTTVANELAISDALVNEIQQVDGILALPVNRSIGAMRALGLGSVDSPAQARALAAALGADALIVGTITAYDPYDPPILGLSLALFDATQRTDTFAAGPEWDPLATRGQASERGVVPRSPGTDEPVAVVAALLDGADGAVRARIRSYANGRSDPESALGWQRYVKSMGLYVKFACYEFTRMLLDSERARMGFSQPQQNQTAAVH